MSGPTLAGGICRWRARICSLRLAPFDTGTEVGRSAERHRRIVLSAAAGLAARLVSAAVSLLTVPLTIGYLGNERYGIWLTVSSVVAMTSFADLGIGNGLLTKVSEADGKGDQEDLRRFVSSGFFMLLAVASGLSLVTITVAPLVDWAHLLGVNTTLARGEVRPVLLALALNYYLAMPFTVVQRVQLGLQAGYASALWTMAGSILTLVGIVIATFLKAGLVPLVLVLSGTPTIITLVNFAWYFGRECPGARPQFSAFDRSRAGELLRTGGMFVVLQLAISLAYISDNVVVARTLGASAVPMLAVPSRLFLLVMLPCSLIVGPLWPAYGEAHARGDSAWAGRTLRRSITASVVVAAAGGLLLLFTGSFLVRAWTRGAVSTGLAVLLPLAIWTCFSAWGQATAAFLNGTGQIRAQAFAAVFMASAAFGLKWLLVVPLGPGGVVWATVMAYFVFTFLPLSWVIRKALRRLEAPAAGVAVW